VTEPVSTFLRLQAVYPEIFLAFVAMLKSTAIVLMAWGTISILKSRSARARCWIWRTALLGICALPMFEFGPFALQRIKVALPIQADSATMPLFFKGTDEVEVVNSGSAVMMPEDKAGEIPQLQARPEVRRSGNFDPSQLHRALPDEIESHVLGVWGLVAVALLTIAIIRVVAGLTWLQRHSSPATRPLFAICQNIANELDVKSQMRVYVSPALQSPLLVGFTTPRIYVPYATVARTPEALRAIFLHELAHWMRCDMLWHNLAKIATCAFWWNPLVALAARRMRQEAEEAADDSVLTRGIPPDFYAEALVHIASIGSDAKAAGMGVPMIGFRSLQRRVQALLQNNPWRGKIGSRAAGAMFAIVPLLVLSVLVYVRSTHLEKPVRFTFVKPDAKAVFLAGEFDNYNMFAIPMHKGWWGGRWTVDLPLPPGRYHYKFVADGLWYTDPENPDDAPNGQGGKNSIKTVSDSDGNTVSLEKDKTTLEVERLFEKGDYAVLDAMAADLRKTQVRFSDGTWKLRTFYEALEPSHSFGDAENWDAWFRKMDVWHRAIPESITEPVAEARGWALYAEKVPGTSAYNERRKHLKDLLDAAARLPTRCPQWYAQTIDAVAAPEHWPKEKFEKLLVEAAKCAPSYYYTFFEAAFYDSNGWYGTDAKWVPNLERFSREFDQNEGFTVYTRELCRKAWWFANIFDESPAAWSKAKQGFLDIQKHYPNSRLNLNAFCQFAVLARDKETARSLFKQIGAYGDDSWGSYGRYQLWREWAEPDIPAWRTTPRLVTQRHKNGCAGYTIHSIAFSPDGAILLSADAGNNITLRNTETGTVLWQTSFGEHPARSVAFSSDGTMFAAGGYEDNVAGSPGLVRVWKTESQAEIASIRPEAGNAFSVCFTPDNRTLVIGGGDGPNKFEGYQWDVQSRTLRPIKLPTGESWAARSVTVSPDSRTVIASCYQSVIVYSLADDRPLLDTRHTTRNFTESAAFSPDGRFAVTAGTPPWRPIYQPGTVSFWDTSSWSEKHLRVDEGTGGLLAVALSPNGKWIAGGGLDQTVHIWDATTAKSKAVFLGHDRVVTTVAFSPDCKTLASAGEDGVIKFWALPANNL
jgi:WD40 repeat protein/beta-lactamase regulating signal transducer with metallopeptidase domain